MALFRREKKRRSNLCDERHHARAVRNPQAAWKPVVVILGRRTSITRPKADLRSSEPASMIPDRRVFVKRADRRL
jgi:hypothetical protein